MQPGHEIKLKKPKPGDDKNESGSGDAPNEVDELIVPKATATRHIFLIRHGQYNLKGETDADRVLTPLGLLASVY